MFTMRPPRRPAIIRAAAAWVTKTRPLRSTSMTVSQEPSSSAPRPCGMFVPALFTRISTLPHSRSIRSKQTRIDASLRTSSRSASDRRPFARSAIATGSASSPFRDVTATSAPASARASAIARPMPREPPVTSARFPSKPNDADICACASIRAMATASVEVRIPNDARDTAALAAELLTKEAQDFLIRLHRKVETTGPTDRKMVINALNSGASVYMADFEDANTPTWRNVVEGQRNLIDAIERRIDFQNPDGKTYKLND